MKPGHGHTPLADVPVSRPSHGDHARPSVALPPGVTVPLIGGGPGVTGAGAGVGGCGTVGDGDGTTGGDGLGDSAGGAV